MLKKIRELYLKVTGLVQHRILKFKAGHPQIRRIVHVKTCSEKIDWSLQSNNIPKLWQESKGHGVKVLILDSGCEVHHPDLRNGIKNYRNFTKTNDKRLDPHGTHVAGIVGARSNGIGVIGVAPECDLYIGKVLGNDGTGCYEDIIEGIKWGIREKVDIINMSLGGPHRSPIMYRLLRTAIKKGIIVVAAAGNEGGGKKNTIGYPGKYNMVISVGSYNERRKRSGFSSVGKEIDLLGPGENILSTYLNKSYARLSGTSMSTPFVSGLCALILSKHRIHGGKTPVRNQKEMLEHLKKICVDIEPKGKDRYSGWGIIHPDKIRI